MKLLLVAVSLVLFVVWSWVSPTVVLEFELLATAAVLLVLVVMSRLPSSLPRLLLPVLD